MIRRLNENTANGLTIYTDKYANIELYEDSYERGELGFFTAYDVPIDGEYKSAEALIKDVVANTYGIYTNDIHDYICDTEQHCLQSDALVTEDSELPTDEEMEQWKNGEIKLYNAHLWVGGIRVGIAPHDITVDEAESFGFDCY